SWHYGSERFGEGWLKKHMLDESCAARAIPKRLPLRAPRHGESLRKWRQLIHQPHRDIINVRPRGAEHDQPAGLLEERSTVAPFVPLGPRRICPPFCAKTVGLSLRSRWAAGSRRSTRPRRAVTPVAIAPAASVGPSTPSVANDATTTPSTPSSASAAASASS